jgi:Ca2+-binding EF-hand superfamily protein
VSRTALAIEFSTFAKPSSREDSKSDDKNEEVMELRDFKKIFATARSGIEEPFSDQDISRIFDFIDTKGVLRISSDEFVKCIRDGLSPYREAIASYVFELLDPNNDLLIDEKEMNYYFKNTESSDLPTMSNMSNGSIGGSSSDSHAIKEKEIDTKVNNFFKSMTGNKDNRIVKKDQFMDHQLSRSIDIESDILFKNG